jgi:hypothetical protein
MNGKSIFIPFIVFIYCYQFIFNPYYSIISFFIKYPNSEVLGHSLVSTLFLGIIMPSLLLANLLLIKNRKSNVFFSPLYKFANSMNALIIEYKRIYDIRFILKMNPSLTQFLFISYIFILHIVVPLVLLNSSYAIFAPFYYFILQITISKLNDNKFRQDDKIVDKMYFYFVICLFFLFSYRGDEFDDGIPVNLKIFILILFVDLFLLFSSKTFNQNLFQIAFFASILLSFDFKVFFLLLYIASLEIHPEGYNYIYISKESSDFWRNVISIFNRLILPTLLILFHRNIYIGNLHFSFIYNLFCFFNIDFYGNYALNSLTIESNIIAINVIIIILIICFPIAHKNRYFLKIGHLNISNKHCPDNLSTFAALRLLILNQPVILITKLINILLLLQLPHYVIYLFDVSPEHTILVNFSFIILQIWIIFIFFLDERHSIDSKGKIVSSVFIINCFLIISIISNLSIPNIPHMVQIIAAISTYFLLKKIFKLLQKKHSIERV